MPLNVVLFEPEIPGNTGNIGRSCVATGSKLHLVGKLGFSLSDRYLKRAGLDYWQHLELKTHRGWDEFLAALPEENPSFAFFEKDAPKDLWDASFADGAYLVFGSETRGFSQELLDRYRSLFYKIPMFGPTRSLNLSSAVAVALYEAVRQVQRSVRI